jgi:predicted RNA-binding protein with PUA-like domain
MSPHHHWLFKTEPSEFSVTDLASSANQTTAWSGIRNYMSRNTLRDRIRLGDTVFVYHSSCDDKGIAGIAEVVREAYPDPSAFDKSSEYYDPKSVPQAPTWYALDVRLISEFSKIVLLSQLKKTKGLEKMMVCQRGARLSIQPVTQKEWDIVCKLAAGL